MLLCHQKASKRRQFGIHLWIQQASSPGFTSGCFRPNLESWVSCRIVSNPEINLLRLQAPSLRPRLTHWSNLRARSHGRAGLDSNSGYPSQAARVCTCIDSRDEARACAIAPKCGDKICACIAGSGRILEHSTAAVDATEAVTIVCSNRYNQSLLYVTSTLAPCIIRINYCRVYWRGT